MKPAFSFQVTGQGAIISFEPGADFNRIVKELRNHVKQASSFFSGVDLYIDIEDCQFSIKQLRKIMNILEKYKEVKNIYFSRDIKSSTGKTSQSRDTVLVKRTIRSGQKIKYPTNIVILGDANPGSEIVAAGNIIVIGKLRGVVHAGAGGSREAEVVALLLEPTQLRIADLISRPPEEDSTNPGDFNPERAFIKNNSIIVEKLQT